jgi:hypothetical protein
MKTCPGGQTVQANEPCPLNNAQLYIRADRVTMCAGEAVHVTAETDAPLTAAFHWTINGQPHPASTRDLTLGTSNYPAGTYRVALTVSAEGWEETSSSATFTVEQYLPPTGVLTANPSEITTSQKSTLSASSVHNQCGGPIQVTFTAPEGTISGATYDPSTVKFDDLSVAQSKQILVTATLKDTTGHTASIFVPIAVTKLPDPRHISDILFAENDSNVTNCGKRMLWENLASYAARDPSGKVILIGHTGTGESVGLDRQRVLNSADLLTCTTGPCANLPPSRIFIHHTGNEQTAEFKPEFCGSNVSERQGSAVQANDPSAKYRRVEVWFVPSGARMPPFIVDATNPPPAQGNRRPASGGRPTYVADVPSAGTGVVVQTPSVDGRAQAPQPPSLATSAPLKSAWSMSSRWWLVPVLAIAAIFMLFGMWTVAQHIRTSKWFRRPTQIASVVAPAVALTEHHAVVRDGVGYVLLANVVVIYHYRDEARVKALCNQLDEPKYRFQLARPGFAEGSPSWQQHFLAALERSDAAIIVLTASSILEEWLRWQIEKVTYEQGKREIPIYVAVLDQAVFTAAHTMEMLEGTKWYRMLQGMKWYQPSPEDQMQLKALLKDTVSAAVRDLRCFISYSHRNKAFAEKLCRDLLHAGVKAWMDVADIGGGTQWEAQIAKAIEDSTHVLFLLTRESVGSPNVRNEIDWARAKHRTVIPILEEDFELPFGWLSTQAINFVPGYDTGFQRLLQDLTADRVRQASAPSERS